MVEKNDLEIFKIPIERTGKSIKVAKRAGNFLEYHLNNYITRLRMQEHARVFEIAIYVIHVIRINFPLLLN